MPYIPVMHIAALRILRLVQTSARRRAGWPVERLRIIFFHDLRNDALIHQIVITHLLRFRQPAVLCIDKLFHLIVAAPQAKACMMAQTFDIVNKLRADIRLKLRRQIINCACKHEVLPYDESELIAEVIEPVLRIVATTPDTNRIKIRPFRLFKQRPRRLRRHPSEQMVLRNIVGTHCKDIDSIDTDRKILAPLIFRAVHRHCAKANAAFPAIQLFSFKIERHFYRIQILSAIAVRPPQLRILDHKLLRTAGSMHLRTIRCRHFYGIIQSALLRICFILRYFLGLCIPHSGRIFHLRAAVHINCKVQRYPAVCMLLRHINAVDSCLIHTKQCHRTEQSRIRQMCTPVPSKHAVRFTDIYKAIHRIFAAMRFAYLKCFCDVFVR